ncbi:MAG: queuosine precursor transporter [Negativicutes bacterium]|jgi:hypothetical protein
MPEKKAETKYSRRFLLFSASFIVFLLTANIASVKIFDFFGVFMDAGTIVFPLSYIFGDVLTEVYGFRRSRMIIWLGFAGNLFLVLTLMIAEILPPAPFWDGQAAYSRILGFMPRIFVASLCAYLVGEFLNSYVLSKLKVSCKGRFLWLRVVLSTIVGQLFDSIIFGVIAFGGTIPLVDLQIYVLVQWGFKSGYEMLISPVTVRVIAWLKKKEQLDTYDYGVRYNPFKIWE